MQCWVAFVHRLFDATVSKRAAVHVPRAHLHVVLTSFASHRPAACTQDEVNEMFDAAKAAQKSWARTPLYKRAELLHKVAALMREHAQPVADCLVKEVAKPAKDSLTEVIRSADLIDYTAEEGVRCLGEGKLLNSDSFPGHGRNKLCLVSKVRTPINPTIGVFARHMCII